MANQITSLADIRASFHDGYKATFGIDLENELRGYDEPTNKIARFCDSLILDCSVKLANEYPNVGNECLLDEALFSALPQFRKDWFYKGLLAQAEYVLTYGQRGSAVKFVRETGLVVDLTQYALSRQATDMFRLGGFCNISRGCI